MSTSSVLQSPRYVGSISQLAAREFQGKKFGLMSWLIFFFSTFLSCFFPPLPRLPLPARGLEGLLCLALLHVGLRVPSLPLAPEIADVLVPLHALLCVRPNRTSPKKCLLL